ncbi:MAG: DUF294 nucleotidyltransferase-like domain-containing protein, partial [Bacteroidota bacterium]
MNAIPDRVEHFLKQYPPFSKLHQTALAQLASTTVIKHLIAGDYIFREGDQPGQNIYVVQDGAIALVKEDQDTLIEVCDEGDIFGIRPLLAEEPYLLSAKASEESILYALDLKQLKSVIEKNPQLGFFLAQHLAEGISKKYSRAFQTSNIPRQNKTTNGDNLATVQIVTPSKRLIYSTAEKSIKAVAIQMKKERVGSIPIVDKDHHPIGIVTNKDLRDWVATGEVDSHASIRAIMSSPVYCLASEQTVAEIQMFMIQKGIHHVCITRNGTAKSPIIGIISQHNLLLAQGNNPAVLIKAIQTSKDDASLAKYREKAEHLLYQYLLHEVSIDFIASVMTAVNDALIYRVIELANNELKEEGLLLPEIEWCWMGLGSEGRGEQLLRTDQDNALVFEDVPADELEDTRSAFLRLAKSVTHKLNNCGFEYCPADMMASNLRWCLSLREWKLQFSKWILTPSNQNILHCSIFF